MVNTSKLCKCTMGNGRTAAAINCWTNWLLLSCYRLTAMPCTTYRITWRHAIRKHSYHLANSSVVSARVNGPLLFGRINLVCYQESQSMMILTENIWSQQQIHRESNQGQIFLAAQSFLRLPHLSIYLSILLSIPLSMPLSIPFSIYQCLSIPLSISQCLSLFMSPSLHPSSLSISLSFFPSISPL